MTDTRPTGPVAKLALLAEQASVCTRCRLAEGRTNVVFGMGDPAADLMIVGEGPGKREDEQGLPFVGPSGRLLDELLAEIGLSRDSNVYIANVVKCRPPGNRDPREDEIESCKPYLRSQLSHVDPKVVLTLGNFAAKLLLRTETGITRLRGRAYPWWRRRLVPTFHPAAALRGSARVLEEMRYDFGLVQGIISGAVAASPAGAREASDGIPEDSAAPAEPDQLGLF